MDTDHTILTSKLYGVPLFLYASYLAISGLIRGYVSLEDFCISFVSILLCIANTKKIGKNEILSNWILEFILVGIIKLIGYVIFQSKIIQAEQLFLVFGIPLISLLNDICTLEISEKISVISQWINRFLANIASELIFIVLFASILAVVFLPIAGIVSDNIAISQEIHWQISFALPLIVLRTIKIYKYVSRLREIFSKH